MLNTKVHRAADKPAPRFSNMLLEQVGWPLYDACKDGASTLIVSFRIYRANRCAPPEDDSHIQVQFEMSRATPRMRDVAERLIAYETRGNTASRLKNPMAFLVDERLRPHLATLMGNLGFRTLLSRALVLANAEVAWLRGVHVDTDGSLEGLDELEARVSREEFREGCVVLLTQFFGLLVTFIGEDLTLRLVRELWPKLPLKGDKT